ncbi:hypothetical protein GO491_04700 [Flavobacteriaceae bacterium Ap0902]|nr:hypothetical protein [Flavobacteriaceae bacterium Ap0902]
MNKNQLIGVLILSLSLVSCGTSLKTNLTNNYEREKLTNDEVFIIYDETELPKESKEIGSIKIGDSGFSTKCSKEEVLNDAINTAKTNNSNIIFIDELKEPNFHSSCYRLEGRIFYNNSENMNELWAKSNNVFDENADYAIVHFLCKEEKPSGLTYMKAGLVGGTYKVSYNNEKFKISEYSVITKKVLKEGLTEISGSSYTRRGEVEIDIKHGHEYFITITTHTNMGTRVVLEEISKPEGLKLKKDIETILKQIEETKLQRQKEKEQRKLERQKRRALRKNQ